MKHIKTKTLSLLFALVLILGLTATVPPTNISKAAQRLVSISTPEEFRTFISNVHAGRTYAGKIVALSQNIAFDHTVVNLDSSATGVFEGMLDGRGFSITGINMDGGDNACLFNIGTKGEVRNLLITESYFTGTVDAAAIADVNEGVIRNCIVHRNRIYGVRATAGLVCKNRGKVLNSACLDSTLKAEHPESYEEGCGGIAMSNSGAIENCCNTSSLEVGGGVTSCGGIVAYMEDNPGALLNICYSMGKLNSQSKKGGIIGFFMNGVAQYCYCSEDMCKTISGDISLGKEVECTVMPGVTLLKPDFALALNTKIDPARTDLTGWNANPNLGAVIPGFPGQLDTLPPAGAPAFGAPKKVKAKCIRKGTIRVTWKKIKSADGYSVEVSYNKKFKKAQKHTAKTTKCVIKKLKKNKTVFVRVRGFVSDDDGPWYGKYSKAVKIKVKKK